MELLGDMGQVEARLIHWDIEIFLGAPDETPRSRASSRSLLRYIWR
jgi:hypothetical protein